MWGDDRTLGEVERDNLLKTVRAHLAKRPQDTLEIMGACLQALAAWQRSVELRNASDAWVAMQMLLVAPPVQKWKESNPGHVATAREAVKAMKLEYDNNMSGAQEMALAFYRRTHPPEEDEKP